MTCFRTRDLSAGWPLSWPNERYDRLARVALEDVDRLEAVPARMRVEKRELLAAVHEIVGIVDVEHDGRRRDPIGLAEYVDETDADAVERTCVGKVLQPRDGRLARQAGTALGRAVDRDLERRVVAERIEVVGVLVAAGDGDHARRHHIGVTVRDEQPIARLGQRSGDGRRQPEPARGLPQDNGAAVGAEVAGIARSCERLGLHGRQPGEEECSLHGDGSVAPRWQLQGDVSHQNLRPNQLLRRRPSPHLSARRE